MEGHAFLLHSVRVSEFLNPDGSQDTQIIRTNPAAQITHLQFIIRLAIIF